MAGRSNEEDNINMKSLSHDGRKWVRAAAVICVLCLGCDSTKGSLKFQTTSELPRNFERLLEMKFNIANIALCEENKVLPQIRYMCG